MESGILITNIKNTVDERVLRNAFEKFGKIIYLNICLDKFNSNSKICYLNYQGVENAKRAIEEYDKSINLGEPLRISYKKISQNFERTNGNGPNLIPRTQSFGRGRGVALDPDRCSRSPYSSVVLNNIVIPLNTKILVEIVELKNLSEILARPLVLTNDSKSELADILGAVNENVYSLVDVRVPEINGYYLAKWEEDGNFYRAKLLEKSGNSQYKVCFVDEGTSGDVVKELKEIPKEISGFPCQFLPCDMLCETSEELIDLIIKSGSDSKVSIYVTNPELKNGKYRINLFINDVDVVDLFKRKYKQDPRINRLPNEVNLKTYQIASKFSSFHIISFPKEPRDIFKIVLTDTFNMNPKVEPLSCSPITGDLVIYQQSENYLHRCVVTSTRFINSSIGYNVRLVDEDRSLETSSESLLETNDKCLETPPRVVHCVLSLDDSVLRPGDEVEEIIIDDIDKNKPLYSISISKAQRNEDLTGKNLTVNVCFVESCDEFYIRSADTKTFNSLNEIETILNSNCNLFEFTSTRDVVINQIVAAPFEGVNYRAQIKEIDNEKRLIRVFFIDFGNSDWVEIRDIRKVKDKIMDLPGFVKRCRFPVKIKSNFSSQVKNLLTEYSENGELSLCVNVVTDDVPNGVLSVNLSAENKSHFIDILKFKNFIDEENTKSIIAGDERSGLIAKIIDLERRLNILEKFLLRK